MRSGLADALEGFAVVETEGVHAAMASAREAWRNVFMVRILNLRRPLL
jgi:hypothetical protein